MMNIQPWEAVLLVAAAPLLLWLIYLAGEALLEAWDTERDCPNVLCRGACRR